MKGKELFLIASLLSLLVMQNASAQYGITDLTSAGWTQITSISQTDIGDNYYVITDESNSLMLGLSDSQTQGNKAVFYQTPANPVNDLYKVWYLEVNGSDYAMRNLAYDYLQLQTEWSASSDDLRWRTNDQRTAISWTRLSMAYDAGSWQLTTVQYGRPLGIYNDADDQVVGTPADGVEIGANDLAYRQKFQIYAISRINFVKMLEAGASQTNPKEITGIIFNSDFNQTANTQDFGWEVTRNGGNYEFNGAVEAYHTGNFDIHQSIKVPNGQYKLTVQADKEESSQAQFYVKTNETKTAEVESTLTGDFSAKHNAIDEDNTAALVQLDNVNVTNETITFGLKDENNANGWLVFDNFRLYYIGQTIAGEAMPFTNGMQLEAGQWYYYDVYNEGEYYDATAGNNLNNVVYTYEGNTLLSEEGSINDNFQATANQFTQTRIYFKSTETQTLTFKSDFTVKNGTYYLYNEYTGRFLGRGANWGTHAVADLYGAAVNISTDLDGYSLIQFVDNELYLGDQSWLYTDCGTDRQTRFQILQSTVDGVEGFHFANTKFNNSVNDKLFLYVYCFDNENKYKCAGNSVINDNISDWRQTVWKLLTKEEHDAIVGNYPVQNKQNIIDQAGINTTPQNFETYLSNLYTPTVHSTYIFNNTEFTPTERTQDGQPAYDDNGKWIEAWQATGTWTKTITDLPQGIYKISFNGYERHADNAKSYDLGSNGWNFTSTYLSANGEQVRFSSWFDNVEKDGDAYNPNTIADGTNKFDDGNYLNEVYAYVGDDGKLTLTVRKPGWMNDCWVLFSDITLTRYEYNEPVTGTYYLKNENTGQFLSFEGNWGTFYSMSDVGEPLTLNVDQEGYNIMQSTLLSQNNYMYSTPSNNGYAFSDGNNTSGGEKWTIAQVEDGLYTIKNVSTGRFLSGQTDNQGGLMLETSTADNNTYWRLYTKDQLKEMVTTTAGQPVDASIFISEPDLNRSHNPLYYEGSTDWKIFGFGGLNATGQGILALAGVQNANNYSYAYLENNDFFNALQTIKGLPNGVYVVSCQGAFRDGDNNENNTRIADGKYVNRAYLYANTNTSVDTQSETYVDNYSIVNNNFTDVYVGAQLMPLKIAQGDMWNSATNTDVASAFYNKQYTNQIPVVVNNGQLTIGVVQEIGINRNLVAFDNFRLTYYGTGDEALKAAYNVAKNNLQSIKDNMFGAEATGAQEKNQIEAALLENRTDYEQAITDYNKFAKEFGESSISRHIYEGLAQDRTNGLYTQEKYPWAGNTAFNDMEQYYNGTVDPFASLANLRNAITATRMFVQANAEARKIEEDMNLTGEQADAHREARKAIIYGTSPITFEYGEDRQFANVSVEIDTHGGSQTSRNYHSWMPRDAYGNRYYDYWNYYGNNLTADYNMTITGLPAGKYIFTIGVSQGNMESILFTEKSTLDGNVVNNASREIFDNTQPQWGINTHNWQDIWCTANITNPQEVVDLSFMGISSLNAATINFTNLRIYRIQDADELLLDEEAEYLSKKVDYVDAKLVLRRSLNKNLWNTIVLPVNLSAEQVEATFGDGVQLAKADYVYTHGTSDNPLEVIHFSTQTEPEIQAGEFYLIKPTVDPSISAEDEYSYINTVENEGGISRTKTLTGCPIWFIDGVNYNRVENEDGTVDNTHGNPTSSSNIGEDNEHVFEGHTTNPIQLHGFYSVGKFTVGEKYIYAFKNNGELQMLTRGTTTVRNMKGFRWYIQDVDGSLAKALGYVIDDGDMGDPTEIGLIKNNDDIQSLENAKIYDLQGRVVDNNLFRNGNAPKGVYIVNGKKILVK